MAEFRQFIKGIQEQGNDGKLYDIQCSRDLSQYGSVHKMINDFNMKFNEGRSLENRRSFTIHDPYLPWMRDMQKKGNLTRIHPETYEMRQNLRIRKRSLDDITYTMWT